MKQNPDGVWPKAKWWQWGIYKLFRWAWNPLLRANPAYRAAILDTMLCEEKRRFGSIEEMVKTITPRFYVEHWLPRNKSVDKTEEV